MPTTQITPKKCVSNTMRYNSLRSQFDELSAEPNQLAIWCQTPVFGIYMYSWCIIACIVALGLTIALSVVPVSQQNEMHVVENTFFEFASNTITETHVFTATGCSNIISATNDLTLHNEHYNGIVDAKQNHDVVTFTAECPGQYDFSLRCGTAVNTYKVYVAFDANHFMYNSTYIIDNVVEYVDFKRYCALISKCLNSCDTLRRWRAFQINKKQVNTLNSLSTDGLVYSTNKLSLYTLNEYTSLLGYRPNPSDIGERRKLFSASLPPSPAPPLPLYSYFENPYTIDSKFNYRVRNQNLCGDCYAYSAIETLETAIAMQIHENVIGLSVYHGSSCTGQCGGGNIFEVWNMLNGLKYIVPLDPGPYTGSETSQYCEDSTRYASKRVPFERIEYTFLQTVDDIQTALTYSPVSTCVYGYDTSFNTYTSGVMECTDWPICDHAVTIVGYNRTSGYLGYWIVKNSWGTDWGIHGYFHLSMHCTSYIIEYGAYALTVVDASTSAYLCDYNSALSNWDDSYKNCMVAEPYDCCFEFNLDKNSNCVEVCGMQKRPWTSSQFQSSKQNCTYTRDTPACPNNGGFPENSTYWTVMLDANVWGHSDNPYCQMVFGSGSYRSNPSNWTDCGSNGGKWWTASVQECCTDMTDPEYTERIEYLRNLSSTTTFDALTDIVTCRCGARASFN
jgi:KDEL-tailed cysteine endopeptidase